MRFAEIVAGLHFSQPADDALELVATVGMRIKVGGLRPRLRIVVH